MEWSGEGRWRGGDVEVDEEGIRITANSKKERKKEKAGKNVCGKCGW